MIEHFRRLGDKRADTVFDAYLTRLANQSALRNGEVPVSTVCAQAASLISTANALGDKDFRHYAAEKAVYNRKYYHVCK
jgi:hypothetical protein